MEKNEILRRAQDRAWERPDEREVSFDQKGRKLAMRVGVVLCILVAVCKHAFHQPAGDVMFLLWAISSIPCFYMWYRLREGLHLLGGMVFAALAAIEGGGYLCFLLG